MFPPSLAECGDLSVGCKLADFLPAPATVLNVALVITVVVTVQHFPIAQIDPLKFAMNAIGHLFSSKKPQEIPVQVVQVVPVSPTPTIQLLPTPTLQYQPESQPESTSSMFYVIAVCIVFILVGAVFTVLRKSSTAKISSPSSSVNVRPSHDAGQTCHNGSSSLGGDIPEDFGSRSNETPVAPNNDPIDPSSSSAESESKLPGNGSSKLNGEIGGSPPPPPPPSFTTSGMDDDSNKNASGFLEKLKMFLVLFVILTTFTHGGRITQKIRSLAIRDDLVFSSNNATATFTPYIPVAFTDENTLVPEIMDVDIKIPSHNEIPMSQFSSDSNEKYDSIPLLSPTKDMTTFIPTSVSIVTGAPITTLDLVLEYIKFFTILFVLYIFLPILCFVLFVLPTVLEMVKISKSQRETLRHAGDGQVMKFKVDANEVVHATDVVENSKVDINIIHDKVIPAFIDKEMSKALEAVKEKDDTAPLPLASEDSLNLATPPETLPTPRSRRSYVPPPSHVRKANKRARKAEKAAIEAALNAPFI